MAVFSRFLAAFLTMDGIVTLNLRARNVILAPGSLRFRKGTPAWGASAIAISNQSQIALDPGWWKLGPTSKPLEAPSTVEAV